MKAAAKAQKSWLDPSSFRPQASKDPLEIDAVHHLEFYVENARQASLFYCHTFGFVPIAYRGPETGFRSAASYVLAQNDIRFVLTSPLQMDTPIASAVHKHSDHVCTVAFKVPDCQAFYYETMRRGAESAETPQMWEDSQGATKRAAIKTYGDTIHAIIECHDYKGVFWPGYVPYTEVFPTPFKDNLGLLLVDHIVGNVQLGKMEHWVSFYEKVLGFTQLQQFTDKDISTEYSALMSKVMSNGTGRVKFPINEPATGRKKSQIEEYLDFNNGPGVQHVALQTKDIIKTVSTMRDRGVVFLKVPKTYYDEVPNRVGKIKEDLATIASLGILVDRDDEGYLLQIFTKPVQDRPTLFFEIIQREGSKGFGIGNFKALFEAIERDQELRGNL